MAPIEPEDAQEYYGGSGDFTSIRKLVAPGQKVTVKLWDIVKNHKTKYPIKDKDFNYRVSIEKDGKRYLLDINGKDTLKQVIAALYPNGPTGKLSPCFATISRRTERKTYQGEVEIVRGDALTVATAGEEGDSNESPF